MNRKLVIVGHWEHSQNEILHTVLGSCISVCFYCPDKKILTMSHMLLPSEKGNNFGRKGGNVMLNEAYDWLIHQGVSKKTLEISMFGGGEMFLTKKISNFKIGKTNIDFTIQWLKEKNLLNNIKVKKVGGPYSKNIAFNPITGECKYLEQNMNLKEEEPYGFKSTMKM